MNDADLAILGIIAEAPIKGYDLQTVIDHRNIRMWTMIGVESVYYVIEKLTKQGLIEAARKNRSLDSAEQLFRITPAGQGVLQTAIMDMLSTPRNQPQSFELGLSSLPLLRPSQVRHALYSYRDGLRTRRDHLLSQLSVIQAKPAPPFHTVAMFDHQIALLEREMEWLEKWLPAWEEQAPPEPESGVTTPKEEIPRMQQLIRPDDPDSFHKLPTRKHPAAHDLPPAPSADSSTQVNRGTRVIRLDNEDDMRKKP